MPDMTNATPRQLHAAIVERIARLREAEAKATSAPWEADYHGGQCISHETTLLCYMSGIGPTTNADHALIAASRNAWLPMLAALEQSADLAVTGAHNWAAASHGYPARIAACPHTAALRQILAALDAASPAAMQGIAAPEPTP
jgi:hypothetical protein